MANFGKSIRNEHDNFNFVTMAIDYDPAVEDLKRGLDKIGDIKLER